MTRSSSEAPAATAASVSLQKNYNSGLFIWLGESASPTSLSQILSAYLRGILPRTLPLQRIHGGCGWLALPNRDARILTKRIYQPLWPLGHIWQRLQCGRTTEETTLPWTVWHWFQQSFQFAPRENNWHSPKSHYSL